MMASGMWMPGTLERIQRAVLAEASGPDAAHHEALFDEAEVADAAHVGAEHRHVEAVLALHELRAGGDLLGEPVRPEIDAAARTG